MAEFKKNKKMNFDTLAIHAGQEPDPTTGAIMTPIFQSSTYVQKSPGQHKGFEYSRTRNPTRDALEACLASLEGARFGLAFSSGCAATTTIMHLLKSGDHVICCDDVYGGTFRLLDKVIRNNGIEPTFIDLSESNNLKKAITPKTKMVWMESPTNPLLKLCDLEKCAKICKENKILSVVDNTFMTPFFQKPLNFGVDIVVHSTTKYINGHSDVVGGFLAVNDSNLANQLGFLQNSLGAIPGPFDCWLVLRGVKTLGVRMRMHQENALKIAQFLEENPQIENVIYPGLKSHPQHSLAKNQMKGYGGMISMEIKGGLPKARSFLEKVQIFSLAESLGGVESLIEHPAIMTHASIPKEIREKIGIRDGLVRLSVGIEDLEDLIEDLQQALGG